jgi:hypothetical protein
MRTNKSCTAGDENPHEASLVSHRTLANRSHKKANDE